MGSVSDMKVNGRNGLPHLDLANSTAAYHTYAFLFFVASLLLTGYAVYTSNQSIQIPLVQLLNNPALYPNDPYAATLPYYASTLWRVVAVFAQAVPLEPLLLTLFLLERLFVIYAAGHLARAFVPTSRLAPIVAMALFALAPAPILGSGTVVTVYFEHTGLSIPFILMAIAAFYRSRSIEWAIWAGISFNLNSLYGIFLLSYCGAVWLLDADYRRAWKSWVMALGVFALVSLPAVLLSVAALRYKAATVDVDLWYRASQARFPHHLYPLTWKPTSYLRFGVLVGLLLLVLWQVRQSLNKLFKSGVIWTIVCIGWLLYAFVAAYILRGTATLPHPGRATDLWYCIAGIAIASVCAHQIEERPSRKAATLALGVFGILVGCLTMVLTPRSLSLWLLIAAIAAILWQPSWNVMLQRGDQRRISLLLVAWVAVTGLWGFANRARSAGIQSALIYAPSSEMRQLGEWASAKTPVDAMFLLNPVGFEQFRSLAKRPVFTSWKDGSAIFWSKPFVTEWTQRLQLLGFDMNQANLTSEDTNEATASERYRQLGDREVKQLARQFPIRYWVVEAAQISSFPVVFQTSSFKVLAIQ